MKLHQRNKHHKKIRFISVNIDDRKDLRIKARLYAKRMKMEMPLYFDQNNQVRDFFKLKDPPMTLIISPESKIIYRNHIHYKEQKYINIVEQKLTENLK